MARPSTHPYRALLAGLLLLLLGPAALASFDAGLQAWDRGEYDAALRELQRAADDGDARAQNHLAQMYEDGQGTAVDMDRAVQWYRRAAEAGNPSAQLNLGRLYRSGKGVAQSDDDAVRWYLAAAEQGLAIAQFFMGLLYDTGKGVPSDYVQAYKWFDLAARQGDTDARHKRDRLAAHMTPAQMLEAERLTRVFLGEEVASVAAATTPSPQGGPERNDIPALALARPATTPDVAPAPAPAPAHQAGAEDGLDEAEVRTLQGLLNELGYNAGTVDGIAGAGTRAALRRFRADAARPGDGEIDRQALAQLQAVHTQLPAPPSPPSTDEALVRRIQESLINLGYEPGPADGVLGTRTVSAARQYRQDLDLPAEDTLDAELLRWLERRLAVRGAARGNGQQELAAAAISAARGDASDDTVAPSSNGAAVGASPADTTAAAPVEIDEATLARRVQAGLTELGFDPGPIDGQPGRRTREAVQAFQTAAGLPASGAIDEALLARIEAGEVSAAPAFVAPRSDEERVRRAQTALARLGLDPGPADGVAGRRTREALERYQSRLRLEPDGQLTDALLERMESPDSDRLSGPRLRFVRPANERELVRRIQVRLNSLGYAAGAPDGVAGDKTASAARDFQSAMALPATGQLDEQLLRQLESSDAERKASAERVAAVTPQLVSDIQRELNRLGYPAGTVDGILGERTVKAAQAFQRDVGLQVSDRLTPALLDNLRAAQ